MTDVEVKDIEMKEEQEDVPAEVPVDEAAETEEVAEDVEMKEEVKEEAPKEEEKNVENEPNEEESSAKRFTDKLELSTEDATLNAIVTCGSVINALNVGQSFLLAGARANIGIKSGRYMVEYCLMVMGQTHSDLKIGFSLPNSTHFLGEKNTIGFQISFNKCSSFVEGETKEMKRCPKGIRQGDILAVYLNRTADTGNTNTISLFINGVRHGDSVEIPDSFKEQIMVPHCNVKQASLELNLSKTARKEYPFVPRVFGDALESDVTAIKMNIPEKTEIIVPVGNVTKEWIEKFMESKVDEQFTDLSSIGYKEWMSKSNAKLKGGVVDSEFKNFMEKMILIRKRRYLLSFNNNLQKKDRKALTTRLGMQAKISALVDDELINALPKTAIEYKLYSIPTVGEAEGFNGGVTFSESLEKSQDIFKSWVRNNRAHAKVDGLKPSTTYKEKMTEWKKYVEEQKKALSGEKKPEIKKEEPKEGEEVKKEEVVPPACESIEKMKEWTPEDWMLADLRYELHLLVTCFKTDLETLIVKQVEEKASKVEEDGKKDEEDEIDPPFTTFTMNNMDHYYKLYAAKPLNPTTWGVKKHQEIVNFVKDAITLEGESEDVVASGLAPDVDFLKILQLTEAARQERNDRLTAGDEKAILPFKAPKPPLQRISKGTTSTTGAIGKGQGQNQRNNQQYGNNNNNNQQYGNNNNNNNNMNNKGNSGKGQDQGRKGDNRGNDRDRGYGGTGNMPQSNKGGNKGSGKGNDGKGGPPSKLGNMRMVPTANVGGGMKRPHDGGNNMPAKRFNKGSW